MWKYVLDRLTGSTLDEVRASIARMLPEFLNALANDNIGDSAPRSSLPDAVEVREARTTTTVPA